MIVDCAKEFKDSQVTAFLRSLYKVIEEKEVTINFNTLNFVLPYGTLLAALGIREFVKKRNSAGLKTGVRTLNTSRQAINYLKYFGFFKFIGLKAGNDTNSSSGSFRYIPITVLTRKGLDDYDGVLQERIEKKSEALAKIIFSSEQDSMKALMLSYCLREIIRNTFEHADIDECVIMAQKWSNGYAEIAIADEGIGILGSLSKVHGLINAEDAIKLAVLPGISKETAPDNENDEWQNSGFGLYVVAELGRKFGDFAISSNGIIIHKYQNEEVIENIPLSGTVVKLKIKTEDAEYFPNILHNIVEEGENTSADIPGARKSASKQTRLIDGA